MKKRHAIIFIIFQFSIIISAAQGWWYKKKNFNLSPRSAAVGFAIDTVGFVGTGTDSTAFRRNFSVYHPSINNWTPAQSLGNASGSGLARDAASAFVIGAKAYVGLGQGSNPFFQDFWQYDPAIDVWTQVANFGGTARRSAVAFAANGNGYVACGQDVNGFKKDLWMYDTLTNTWTQKTSFPGTARRLPVAFVIGTNAYVGTGDDGVFKKDFYEYDAVADSWTAKAAFGGTPRYGAVAFSVYFHGFVGTGYDNTLSNKKDFWEYDPLNDVWFQVADFGGTARSNAVAFTIGSYAYVGTGFDSLTTTSDIWSFDPYGVGEQEFSQSKAEIKILPNPFSESAAITLDPATFNSHSKISFLLYDLSGREVKQVARINSPSVPFNRENLESGIYFYKVVSGNTFLASGKIIVQ